MKTKDRHPITVYLDREQFQQLERLTAQSGFLSLEDYVAGLLSSKLKDSAISTSSERLTLELTEVIDAACTQDTSAKHQSHT
ncbi:hypothetical protein [Ferrimonas pelagia]|uniref:CopG family transcriptional regulator n=1 Tax=Ferrimonas pelagia TaxID=1177826 RepID=A0ABP9ELZ9_9GAMM